MISSWKTQLWKSLLICSMRNWAVIGRRAKLKWGKHLNSTFIDLLFPVSHTIVDQYYLTSSQFRIPTSLAQANLIPNAIKYSSQPSFFSWRFPVYRIYYCFVLRGNVERFNNTYQLSSLARQNRFIPGSLLALRVERCRRSMQMLKKEEWVSSAEIASRIYKHFRVNSQHWSRSSFRSWIRDGSIQLQFLVWITGAHWRLFHICGCQLDTSNLKHKRTNVLATIWLKMRFQNFYNLLDLSSILCTPLINLRIQLIVSMYTKIGLISLNLLIHMYTFPLSMVKYTGT